MAVRTMLPALVDTLCQFDAAGCATYRANADSFATALVALDAELHALMEPAERTPVLLSQPFFRYFMQRYGPQLVDIIEPQPAKEPTPRALQSLIRTARERNVQAILVQEQLPARSAQAVAEATGVPLLRLDPIGGTAGRRTYSELLLYNARTVQSALKPTDSDA
jgi:ABC-type Zn uptake system ZnuABC Zn-binding protein ZnuA